MLFLCNMQNVDVVVAVVYSTVMEMTMNIMCEIQHSRCSDSQLKIVQFNVSFSQAAFLLTATIRFDNVLMKTINKNRTV